MDSFVYHIKTKDCYGYITNDVQARSDTSGYTKEDKRQLTTVFNKKKIDLMKDGLGGKIMTEFVAFRAKTLHLQKLDISENKTTRSIQVN